MTFFIIVDRATPSSRSSAHQTPSRPPARRRSMRAATSVSRAAKCVKPCSTTPGTGRQDAARGASRAASPASGGRSSQAVRGHLHQAAEEAAVGAPLEEQRALAVGEDERGGESLRPLGPGGAARQGLGPAAEAAAAGAPPRTAAAARRARDADGGAEIHQGLGAVAGPVGGGELGREAPQGRLGGRQRHLDREEAGEHAFDIAVDRHRRALEGDGRDRGGGIGPDAGKRAQRRLGLWKPAPQLVAHDPGAFVETARAAVIAQPLPCVQDLIELGPGEIGQARPALDEPLEIGDHGGRRRSAAA